MVEAEPGDDPGMVRAGAAAAARRRELNVSQRSLAADGVIAWVGDSAAAGPAEETVELGGALVTPAFVDAHVHATSTGLALLGLDLTATDSLAAALEQVERAARASGGRPLLGHGWDETRWPERRPPTSAELDRASYGSVVYLSRVDVHSAVVSSALAAAAGLRDLDGWSDDGRVERDAHHAARRVTRDDLPDGARRHLHEVALTAAARAGIGSVHEMSAPHIAPEHDLPALLELVDARRGTGQ